MQSLQHLQAHVRKISPFRWILLLWIGFIYLWGVLWGGVMSEQITPQVFLLFTLLMLLHFSLYGISSFRSTASAWFRVVYFAIQALLIVLISVVAHRFTVTLGLYLALVGEIASLLLELRMVLPVGAACLLLFSLNLHLLYGGESVPILSPHPVPFYMALVYVLPAFVLVVGYALQQARARAQTQRLLQELEQAHRQLADDAVRLEDLTRAAERQRMARELHDTLAQGLAGLTLQLEAVKAHLVAGREGRALEIVIQAIGRARTSLATARSAIDDLRISTMTPTDLQHALEEETFRFTAATGIPCTTQFSSLSPVSEACSASILRSVAEGLLNIARHAQASQVWVCVDQHDQELAIEVRDNGRGFDPSAVAQQGHYGLLGLRERARLLDGQFALLTAPGEGTTLRFLLPVTWRGDAR
ncbi:sensor histidine kinase YdfH [Ktedonobacteria bacterium brp13]|nr:sensor histidine kinase YdfH [Ktedonobacteria bacterium brp13]